MKAKILLCSMLILGSLSYAAETTPTDSVAQEVMSEVKSIEAEYQELMQKEAERKEEFKQEKEILEKEVQELKERQLGREELYAKLKEDSKVRWHRDEYKKLLKRFDEYYNKLEQKIADKEQQIAELTKLLEVLNSYWEGSMQKFLKATLFLCALSSLAYAEDAASVVTSGTTMSAEEQKDAMDILDRMRAKIEKEEAEKAKLVAEAKELGMSPSEIASMDNVDEMLKAKREAEAKPKTEAEKLELTRKKAMDKLDFYERVVRSVAREENEVSDYYEIMGEKKQRSTVMLGTAPEEAPAEQQQVEQNAAPTEAQAAPETKVEEAK